MAGGSDHTAPPTLPSKGAGLASPLDLIPQTSHRAGHFTLPPYAVDTAQ